LRRPAYQIRRPPRYPATRVDRNSVEIAMVVGQKKGRLETRAVLVLGEFYWLS
jgi:hypothetical protein